MIFSDLLISIIIKYKICLINFTKVYNESSIILNYIKLFKHITVYDSLLFKRK